MRFLVDFVPIIVFFAVYKFWGIYIATAAAIAAVALQVLATIALKKKVSPVLWISLAVIAVFGGATLFFHNEWFIKMKPTVLYFILSAAFYISDHYFKKNLFKVATSAAISLSEDGFRLLSNGWAGFFLFLGILNLFAAYFLSTNAWVNFKLFGLLGLSVLFVIVQTPLVVKYTKENP